MTKKNPTEKVLEVETEEVEAVKPFVCVAVPNPNYQSHEPPEWAFHYPMEG